MSHRPHRIISIFPFTCSPYGIFEIFCPHWCVCVRVCLRCYVIIKVNCRQRNRGNLFTLEDHISINREYANNGPIAMCKSEKTKTHEPEWNIFISFQQEILKHKIESEFRLHILAISRKLLLCAFSHMNGAHHLPNTMAKTKRLRKFRATI